MAQFLLKRGNLAGLNNLAIQDGQFIVVRDEGAIYVDIGTERIRMGDFIQVADVASLPTSGANVYCMYYCVKENVLARYDGSNWIQINKQPTAEEMKTLLGLGALAYKSVVAEADLDAVLKEKVNAAAADNHSHANKVELDKIVAGDKDKWDTAVAQADANKEAIAKIKDDENIDSFADVAAALANKQDTIPANTYDAYGAASAVAGALDDYKVYVGTFTAVNGETTVVGYVDEKVKAAVDSAKQYADANDANTTYGIEYDSTNKKIKLVESGTTMEIDATAFIKDGMVSGVAIEEVESVKNLVITFNTDAGKEAIKVPLTELVDIYTGVNGEEINVTVSSDNKISAELKNGTITKERLAASVQASLGKADTALQAHQDISHLATEADLTQAKERIAVLEQIDHEAYIAADTALKAELQGKIDAGDAATLEAAKADAANKSAVVLAEAQTYADGKVAALAGNVYTKAEVEALLTWGEF